MAIDKSGKWWVGSQPEDLKEYLEAYSSGGYKTHEFRLAKCKCGRDEFFFFADDDEGCAKRICSFCGEAHFVCDSQEWWTNSNPEEWKCAECGSKSANIGVGFSVYEDGEIRWLYVGERCASCGILGCFAGWKVAYSPSKQLMDQV
ncbi:hypothetical protein EDE15_1742 [Edaphobacter aggregans]|uniref:Uncharacterized protein n=1 Tax=Edaphobacter aggregans TaxID=570835 RepID=A0A428MGV4_9BACT|nr:hypothetical protein EDE15_1742 [Edaphobacter aggregans]